MKCMVAQANDSVDFEKRTDLGDHSHETESTFAGSPLAISVGCSPGTVPRCFHWVFRDGLPVLANVCCYLD